MTTPVLAFGALPEPPETTCLWAKWNITAGKRFMRQLPAASRPLASWLGPEPTCVSTLPVSVLAAGSSHCFGAVPLAVPPRDRAGRVPGVPAGA